MEDLDENFYYCLFNVCIHLNKLDEAKQYKKNLKKTSKKIKDATKNKRARTSFLKTDNRNRRKQYQAWRMEFDRVRTECYDRLVCEVCGRHEVTCCSDCLVVGYCSKEHQRKHWLQHKSMCKRLSQFL